jgi:hypothetical protein
MVWSRKFRNGGGARRQWGSAASRRGIPKLCQFRNSRNYKFWPAVGPTATQSETSERDLVSESLFFSEKW